MRNCAKCERELEAGEGEYCPACASSKSHKIKRILEVAGPLALAAAGIAFKLLRKK